MSDQLIVEPAGLEKKDKSQLQAIVAALGGESNPRQTKAELISEITKLSSAELPEEEPEVESSDESNGMETSKEQPATKASEVGEVGEPTEPTETNEPSEGNKSSNNAADQDSPNSRRSAKRGRGKNMERQEAGNDPVTNESQSVSGFLDLRDEGYGFLRVAGFLPSKEDVYVSVKQVRQFGLRKGDHLAGKTVPAHRNEKNPCFSQIDTVNGSLADNSLGRPYFEEMSPVYPSQQIVLESEGSDSSATLRSIDLLAPIAKGQRCFISGPARSGRTSIIKEIVKAVESKPGDANVIILSVDSRPEEVTDLANDLGQGEIVASTFDRPVEEHIATAELTLERAKRLAETGEDVFIVIDSLTQLAKSYISNYVQSSRSAASSVELPALSSVKQLLGGAVNLEGSGSITILSVLTSPEFDGSYLDGFIYEELRNFSNSEINIAGLTLEGPALDILSTNTQRTDLFLDSEHESSLKELKKILAESAENSSNLVESGQKLLEAITKSTSNKKFLSEIVKKGSF